MSGTRFSFTAYNFRMEQILARLLFSALASNDDTREKVIRLLKFYRENRELLLLLFSMTQSPPPPVDAPAPEEETKNRPQETVGSVNVLEAYLNRAV